MPKTKVLLVDDEVDITTTFRTGLERHGFEIDVFNDPEQALRQYKPNYYDAIILDVLIARMTGFDLARKIWAKDERARICFLSAFEIYEEEARKVFVDLKSYCFVKKPIMINDLAKHIERHLSQ